VDYCYLKGSVGSVLVFGEARQSTRDDVPVEGFVNSDFVRCLNTRKSLMDYV